MQTRANLKQKANNQRPTLQSASNKKQRQILKGKGQQQVLGQKGQVNSLNEKFDLCATFEQHVNNKDGENLELKNDQTKRAKFQKKQIAKAKNSTTSKAQKKKIEKRSKAHSKLEK